MSRGLHGARWRPQRLGIPVHFATHRMRRALCAVALWRPQQIRIEDLAISVSIRTDGMWSSDARDITCPACIVLWDFLSDRVPMAERSDLVFPCRKCGVKHFDETPLAPGHTPRSRTVLLFDGRALAAALRRPTLRAQLDALRGPAPSPKAVGT